MVSTSTASGHTGCSNKKGAVVHCVITHSSAFHQHSIRSSSSIPPQISVLKLSKESRGDGRTQAGSSSLIPSHRRLKARECREFKTSLGHRDPISKAQKDVKGRQKIASRMQMTPPSVLALPDEHSAWEVGQGCQLLSRCPS